MDAFDTLGVEPAFDLDEAELGKRHRDLVKALHPDKYVGAPAAERRMALGKTIEVNEAVRVLKDPIRRAEVLARRRGLPVGETTEPAPPPALLMEMMEAREELAEAASAKDAARVEKLGASMRARQAAVAKKLGEAFANEARTADVLPIIGEMRYVRRFLDDVVAFEDSLF
jgi:molecular chaperone HscB